MADPPTGPAPRGIPPAVWGAICIGVFVFGAAVVNTVPALKKAITQTTERALVLSNTQSEQRAPTTGRPQIAASFNAPDVPDSVGDYFTPSDEGQLIEVFFPSGPGILCLGATVNRAQVRVWDHITSVNARGKQVPNDADRKPAYYRIDRGGFSFGVAWSRNSSCPS